MAALPETSIACHGHLYRALNPIWAKSPLSGEGARRHGGRFNPKGIPALYTALTPVSAMDEVNQAGRPFEPITLISYQARLEAIVDSGDAAHRAALGIDPSVLTDPNWRRTMLDVGLAPPQKLAMRLIDLGYEGMIVPSMVPGALPKTRTLVLWHWKGRLQVIDTKGRLAVEAEPRR